MARCYVVIQCFVFSKPTVNSWLGLLIFYNTFYGLMYCPVFQLMSYILIIDDIEDGAKTRCGKPCWHLLPDVGTLAMNDASMLRSFIMELLRQNFENSTFIKLANLFNQVRVTKYCDI